MNLLVATLGCENSSIVAYDTSGNVCGFIPLMTTRSKLGSILTSLPFFGSNGGILAYSSIARLELAKAYNSIASSGRYLTATVIENPLNPEIGGLIDYTYEESRLCQMSVLFPGEGDPEHLLLDSFHSKTRNVVRRALRSGLEVKVDTSNSPLLLALHQENMRSIGGYEKPKVFFTNLSQSLRPSEDFEIYVATLAGVEVAALLILKYRNIVEYYIPATRQEFRPLNPMSLLIYTAMVDASREGYELWNWGGTWSSQSDLYRFKKRWAAIDLRYRYFTYVHDTSILDVSSEVLLNEFPYTFTVPFGALNHFKHME